MDLRGLAALSSRILSLLSPRTESLVGSAVQWAERIMRRIDGTFGNSTDDKRWPRA